MNEKNKIISSLYENYKNTPKKLKIICDWDEVIQAHEPYILAEVQKGIAEKRDRTSFGDLGFSNFFKELWSKELYIDYSSLVKNEVSGLKKEDFVKYETNI